MPTSVAYRRQLGPAVATLNDHINRGQSCLSDQLDEQAIPQLVATQKQLQQTMARISELNKEWIALLAKLSDDKLQAEETVYENFPPPVLDDQGQQVPRSHFMDTYEKGRRLLELIDVTLEQLNQQRPPPQAPPQVNAPPAQNQPASPAVHLPKLELPKFNGDPHQFRTWWAAFSVAVDSQQHLTAYQKHTYLLMCLPPNTPARRAIEHYEPSDTNYQKVTQILQTRFGNDRQLISALYAELQNLPKATESTGSLRNFYETVDRICYQLTTLGESTDTTQTMMQIRGKLPFGVIKDLITKEKSSGATWKLADLSKALNEVIELKEEAHLCAHSLDQSTPSQSKEKQQSTVHKQSTPQHQSHSRSFVAPTAAQQFHYLQGSCSLCGSPKHKPSGCPKYPTAKDRYNRIKEQERCVNCLRPGHLATDCPDERRCRTCNKPHHILLCFKEDDASRRDTTRPSHSKRFGKRMSSPNRTPLKDTRKSTAMAIPNPPETVNSSVTATVGTEIVMSAPNSGLRRKAAYLSTKRVMVTARGRRGAPVEVAVLFDNGSMNSFITKDLVEKLSPPKVGSESLVVQGFGGSERGSLNFNSPMYEVQLKRTDGTWETCILNRTKEITQPFTMAHVDDWVSSHSQLPEVDYACDSPAILLGTRHFWKLTRSWRPIKPGLYLVDTLLGKMIAGESTVTPTTPTPQTINAVCVHPTNVDSMPTTNAMDDWLSLEGIGIREDPTQNDDEQAAKQFEQTIHQLPDGRYSVKWPWIDANPVLPSNFRMAYSRLASTLRSLQNYEKKDLLKQYDEVFKEQERRGMLEPADRTTGIEHYLPHHPVITSKLRVVVDASAHTRGQPSLNDCLYRGPVLLPDLVGILLRARQPSILLIGDLEKAFMSIALDPGIDREVCKILWLKDLSKPLSPDNILIRRYTVVGFGFISAPYALAAVVRHHLRKCGPKAAALIDELYVDNQFLHCTSVEDAVDQYRFTKTIYGSAKMNIREFISNSTAVNEQIPEADRLPGPIAKLLGIMWDTQSDELTFKFPCLGKQSTVTRRTVLSTLHSIYDPIGLIYPTLLDAKIFAQELWELSHSWDEQLTVDAVDCWKRILSGWANQEIRLPRRCIPVDYQSAELHVFADASDKAIAMAAYLRCHSDQQVTVNLIFSKGRMKPKRAAKSLTTPRMELIALLIGVRAKKFICSQLKLTFSALHIWSDSQIALSWVNSTETQTLFVQRRLKEIRKHTDCTFHYVHTSENPADIGTRGATPAQLKDSQLWWNGPAWLSQPSTDWPDTQQFSLADGTESTDGVDGTVDFNTGVFAALTTQPLVDIAKYSTLEEPVRLTAWIQRFNRRCREKDRQPMKRILAKSELDRALDTLIKLDQTNHAVDQSKHLTFTDEHGIVRLRSRLINSNSNPELANPILLSTQSHLTRLIIRQAHKSTLHMGVDWTLAKVLQHYWFPKARQLTKGVIRSCPQCIRMNSYPFARPTMPPLPKDRVSRLRPFDSVGVDYLGPTFSKLGQERHKAWIILFTCLSTRAVHLEPVRDLSAITFTNAFRRFLSRRGCPTKMRSDNGTQFILTDKALTKLLESREPGQTVDSRLAITGISWTFIPQLSPWAGGFYERLVKTVKDCFKRTLGRRVLDWDEFETFTTEVEAVLNQRPLTVISDQPDAPKPLRPVDLLQPGAIVDLAIQDIAEPESTRLNPEEKLIQWWQCTQEAVEMFWQRWTTEYLALLRERAAWNHRGPRLQLKVSPSVNDIVLVEDGLRPRNTWPLGRIIELNGTPPNIRSVQVKLSTGRILTRPVSAIYLLEASQPTVDRQQSTDKPPVQPTKESTAHKETPRQETNQLNEPTQPERTHPMVLRNRTKPQSTISQSTVMGTLLPILCFMLLIGPSTATGNCTDCHVNCVERGVNVSMPPDIAKIEICCEGSCLIRLAKPTFIYELPLEMLVNQYACYANFWNQRSETTSMQITCPAINDCRLIDCTICIDHIANPTCSPRLAAALTAGVICFLISICCIGLCIARACGANLRTLSTIIYYTVGCGVLCSRFTYRKARKMKNRAVNSELGRKAKRQLHTIGSRLRDAGKEWRQNNIAEFLNGGGRNAARYAAFAAILCLLPTASTSSTISVVTRSESCRRGSTGLTCTANFATTLTLLPKGQLNTLLIRDEHGLVLGTFSIAIDSLVMECIPRSDGWYRSYTVNTLAVKRCPTQGSCRADFCEKVRPSTVIPELREVNSQPGISRCVDSSSFWFNGCGLPSNACLFYRHYAKVTSGSVFEYFSCPTWDFSIHGTAKLEVNGRPPVNYPVNLHPGLTQHWNNVSLTPLTASLPPMPVLTTHFITDGHSVAMVDYLPQDLHCSTEEEARLFNCTLLQSTCSDCIFGHSEGSVDCSCRDLNLEDTLADPKAKLPMSVARLQLRNDFTRVYADYGYSPLQLHVQITDMELLLEFQDSKCFMEVHNLTGCYKCQTGAHLSYTCTTDHGSTLAKIECADGTLFTAHCTVNGTVAQETLPFDHHTVDSQCRVECPAGETQFHLKGELYYIPAKRQFGLSHRDSENLNIPASGNWLDFGFDPRSLFSLFGTIPMFVTLVLLLLIGIFCIYVFVKLNPVFRMWRMAARMAMLACLLGTVSPSLALAPAGGPLQGHTSTVDRLNFGHAHNQSHSPAVYIQPFISNFNFSELPDLRKIFSNAMAGWNVQLMEPKRLDQWLDRRFPGWSTNQLVMARATTKLASMEDEGYELITTSTAPGNRRPLCEFAGFSSEPANRQLVKPDMTVDRYYQTKGVTLGRPGLPCLLIGAPPTGDSRHGIRGTSKKSRRRQSIRGQPCWNQGEQHFDLVPPELAEWNDGPIRSFAAPFFFITRRTPSTRGTHTRPRNASCPSCGAQSTAQDFFNGPSTSSQSTQPHGDGWSLDTEHTESTAMMDAMTID